LTEIIIEFDSRPLYSPDPFTRPDHDVTFDEVAGGTEVTFLFESIPPGIRPEDNDAGTRSTLEKLARYVE
jgi:hypothetical protein